jgi:AcrR family transcriptional regulator
MKMTGLPFGSFPGGAAEGPAEPGARDRILDAADRALAGAGYRRMRIEDLAEAAGIAKGTVYLSFPSKEEIALACIDRMAGRVLARMRTLAASRRATPESRLRRILVERVLARFDYARAHSASIDEILIAIRPALLARRLEHFKAEGRVVAGLLHELGQPPRAAAETARAMIDATNILLPYSLSVHEMGRRAEIARRAERIAALVVLGATRRRSS